MIRRLSCLQLIFIPILLFPILFGTLKPQNEPNYEEIESKVNYPLKGLNSPIIVNLGLIKNSSYLTDKNLERIIKVTENRNFHDLKNLLSVIGCESGFREFAVHVNANGTLDRGIAQFNSYWRSDVTDECAFNLECAINKMIDTINARQSYDRWVCAKNLKITNDYLSTTIKI